MQLNILHTNDIHSNYDNYSKVASKIDELKDAITIVLDAGDFADFKRIELQGTKGLAAVELLEHAGYTAITVGNNETFQGVDILETMASASSVPFLSSNACCLNFQPIRGVHKSILLNKCGLRILILGLTPDLGPFNELNGLSLIPYIDALRSELDQNSGTYDLCILLSHVGIDHDRMIAEQFEEIQVIIGGHFHILMDEPEIVNQTIIFTSGCYAEHVGQLQLEVEAGKVILLSGQNINVAESKPKEQILQLLKLNKERAIDALSIPLYPIHQNLWHDLTEENPITNLLADALLDVLGGDIGIINSGVLNGGIRKGSVTQKKLLELCPSPLNPCRYELHGKYLLEALEQALDADTCYADGKGPGFRGKYVGRLHVSNAVILHDGRHITKVLVEGVPLDPEKMYVLASSDYLQRGTGYPSLQSKLQVHYNAEFLRDTLKEYLDKKEFVEQAFNDRWIIDKMN